MEKRFIGVEELAAYLDISVNTVYSWAYQRKIPYHKIGRLVKFDLIKINKWLEDRKIDPAPNLE